MSRHLLTLVLILCPACLWAQWQQSFSPMVKSVEVTVDGNPLLPPLIHLDKHQHVCIAWDELSHDYHRYIYHIEHCQCDWTPSSELFESDYLGGLNDQPVEHYQKSYNTTQLYTHYNVIFPNPQTSVLISGNYRVTIYEDGGSPDEPVLEARFAVYETTASVQTLVTTDTDKDLNGRHQQVELNVGYGTLKVIDPTTEFHTVVLQNRRWDTRVENPHINLRHTHGFGVNHCPQLIFPAGNEFHKFEILDIHSAAMGVDAIEWFEPFHHATLFALAPGRNYVSDEDQNGVRVFRSATGDAANVRGEYLLVHFQLHTAPLPGQDVYVCGQWTNGTFDPDCQMQYDHDTGCYHAAILLKQGYYSYQFVQADGATARTMGDFYQTENEYITLVYFRPQGARTDRLVGYSRVHTKQ